MSDAGDDATDPVIMNSEAMGVYKPDWREARDRMVAWWATGKADRVVAKVSGPRLDRPARQIRGNAEQRATDLETIFWNLDQMHATTCYGAESFPMHFVYMAPAAMGVYLGAPLEFRDESVWQGRLDLTWDNVDRLAFDPANPWWRFTVEQTRQSCLRSRGRYIVTGGGGGALADVMVNLMGCEDTLFAMMERPGTVIGLRDRMLEWGFRMQHEITAVIRRHQYGSADWLRMWCPDLYASTQCDLCVLLSPRMFNDFFLEEIRQESRQLDRTFYHLDGVEAVRHLDALLTIEELDGIQWNPEPQYGDNPAQFAGVFRRIQQAGRKLFISTPPDGIRPLLNAIDRQGVFLSVLCPDDHVVRDVIRELEDIGI